MKNNPLLQKVLNSVPDPFNVSNPLLEEDGALRFNYNNKKYRIAPDGNVVFFKDGRFYQDENLKSLIFN